MKRKTLRSNNKGSALIFSFVILVVLLIVTAGFAKSSITEVAIAKRDDASKKAFWIAEAAINRFVQDNELLDTNNPSTLTIGEGSVVLTKVDGATRVVTAVSTVDGISRSVEATFISSGALDNAMSTGDDINFKDDDNTVVVNGKTVVGDDVRLSYGGSKRNSATFSDLTENAGSACITIPDADNDGDSNDFNDFVTHFNNVISTYPSNEVVHYQTNSNVSINPNSYDPAVKIIFVEGTSVNDDQVDLQFTGSWTGEEITVISTGEINYNHAVGDAANTQVNFISYDDVDFEAAFGVDHAGVLIATDEDVEFDVGSTPGAFAGVISGCDDINFEDDDQDLTFTHDETIASGLNIPPGFEGLNFGSGSGTYDSTYSEWREL